MKFTHSWQRLCALLMFGALLISTAPAQRAQALVPQPTYVSVPGSFNSEIGCPSDWQPDCVQAGLIFDAADGIWQQSFTIPAGSYEHKVAIDRSWSENYGKNAVSNGDNIAFTVTTQPAVKFYFDRATNWVANTITNRIATVVGSFQSELGCPGDWQPNCLRSWMQDVDGDGKYTFVTTDIPVGIYEFKVALDEQWNESYPGNNQQLVVSAVGERVVINWNSRTNEVTIGEQLGDITKERAHWVDRDTIAWNIDPAPASARLISAADGNLSLLPGGVAGGNSIPLTRDAAGLSAELKAKFPHLANYKAFTIAAADLAQVPAFLKGRLAVEGITATDVLIDATGVQIPGVLDDLYTYNGNLGVTYAGAVPSVRLWAPTARSAKLHVFADATTVTSSTVALTLDASTGTWAATGDASWNNRYYLYEVEVYTYATNTVVKNLVTDPYSVSLSRNSTRSQFVDLNAPALKPAGWDRTAKPRLDAPEDITLYELHVRDFSATDTTVPEAQRGTFKAFTQTQSNGMKHLTGLAAAGLSHVHLLPAFDCASINEDKSSWQTPAGDLSALPADSPQQQALIDPLRDQDGFNWCYDPFHFTAPEGSYSTNPNDSTRIVEFREMVQSLNTSGLRVVMDVVYNHTNASGQNEKSVLDRIVPGYYHRLSLDGTVEKSTCCDNTATEHAMMEKLMVDSLVTWARDYKVDGFRFDLMGHHSLANLTKVRDTLQGLTVARDGVDGSKIYIYGEGWNFGEVANDARFVQATQINTAGSGLGTFNDRLRDAARGGGPFSGLQEQGFATGLLTAPNSINQGTPADQRARLLQYQDFIRVGLTGGLRDYQFVDRTGSVVRGAQVDYNGSPAGYTADPQELINYVEAHDNETLFDSVQLKVAATATITDRVRMQWMASDLVLLGQGIPFIHAGQEILRSKSFDRNSYNSGDWFNRLDWTYQTNGFGSGLPFQAENGANWPIFQPLLANPALKPTTSVIQGSAAHYREMLRIRKSSPLFRLRSAAEVSERLVFLNTGPNQVPGLVVMRLSDPRPLHPGNPYPQIVVVFNATPETLSFSHSSLQNTMMRLHPVQQGSADATARTASFDKVTGSVRVPGRTTAVFVVAQRQVVLPLVGVGRGR